MSHGKPQVIAFMEENTGIIVRDHLLESQQDLLYDIIHIQSGRND